MKKNRIKTERLGRRAETIASLYLRFKGYHILERRYKTRAGEIDIIAKRRSVLAIVEVKFRKTLRDAQDSINYKTRQRINKTTEIYLSRTPKLLSHAVRFDAIFIIKPWRIHHEKDLWRDY